MNEQLKSLGISIEKIITWIPCHCNGIVWAEHFSLVGAKYWTTTKMAQVLPFRAMNMFDIVVGLIGMRQIYSTSFGDCLPCITRTRTHAIEYFPFLSLYLLFFTSHSFVISSITGSCRLSDKRDNDENDNSILKCRMSKGMIYTYTPRQKRTHAYTYSYINMYEGWCDVMLPQAQFSMLFRWFWLQQHEPIKKIRLNFTVYSKWWTCMAGLNV